MLAIWSLVPLPFLKPAWTSGSSQFMYCRSLAWRILSITLLVFEMSAIVQLFEHFLALPFFGIEMKSDLFQSCGHCCVFQLCWHIEYSTFTASNFRIWNSSTGILSPPLALSQWCFPRPTWLCISGCLAQRQWSHHCGYLGHEDLFLYSSSVFSCHLKDSCHLTDIRVGPQRQLSAEELMLLDCGAGEESWEFLGLQGDWTSWS